jgi:hypothetical protein
MNKRLYLPVVLILLSALMISGCGFQFVTGSGKVVTENRQVEAFSAVTLAGIGDVYITQAADTSLSIEAEDNLISYFETTVKDGTLTIGIKHEYMGVSLHPTKPVKFHVSTPDVNALTLAGSGNIITTDLQTGNLKLSLLGSGNITNGNLTASSVDINLTGSGNISLGKVEVASASSTIAGSGDISLSGSAASQDVEILGSGNYKANDLESGTADVTVTGSGNGQVWATDHLNVSITGSGDIRYHGKPTVNTAISGSGHVTSND